MNEYEEESIDAIKQAIADSMQIFDYFEKNNYTQREAALTCSYLLVTIMKEAEKNLDDCLIMTKSFWNLLEKLRK